MNISLTMQGWIAGVILMLFKWSGMDIGSDAVNGFIEVVLGFYAILGVYIGRYRLGDITWYGERVAK